MVELWRQCLSDPTITAEEFITGWFAPVGRGSAPSNGVDISISLDELKRDNVKDWLSYALYATDLTKVDEEQSRLLDVSIDLLEERLTNERRKRWRSAARSRRRAARAAAVASGESAARAAEVEDLAEQRSRMRTPPPEFTFPTGFNKALRSYRLNLDPPSCNLQQRPLFYYALTEGIQTLVLPALMRQRGFTMHSEGRLTYWYHPGDSTAPDDDAEGEEARSRAPPKELLEREGPQGDKARRYHEEKGSLNPLVFVHGVGLGPLPYFGFIDSMLSNSKGAPMLVLELPFVSQRLSGLKDAPQEERTSKEIANAMAAHGLTKATFVGHSLGTVYLAWLARLQPQLLASCVFIDPIVFLLHQHKVAQSFLYSRPDKDNTKGHVERYFIKSEHSIVSFFHRHFYWFANILWAEDLRGTPSAIILADSDGIVPVKEVESYLRADGGRSVRKLITLKGQSHGSFLVDEGAREAVLTTVQQAQRWGRSKRRLRRAFSAVASAPGRCLWWLRPKKPKPSEGGAEASSSVEVTDLAGSNEWWEGVKQWWSGFGDDKEAQSGPQVVEMSRGNRR